MKLHTRYTDISDLLAIEDTSTAVSDPNLLLFNANLVREFDISTDPSF